MKLCFLLEDLGFGGVQRHTAELLANLPARFQVAVVALDASEKQGPFSTCPGVSILDVGSGRVTEIAFLKRLAAAIGVYGADVLVTTNQTASLVGGVLKTMLPSTVRRVISFHTTDVVGANGWFRTIALYPFVWTGDGFVFVSRNQEAIWKRRGYISRRQLAIVNGIDTDKFQPPSRAARLEVRKSLGIGEGTRVIGCCAAFRPEKNHKLLLKAFAKYNREQPSSRLILIGDGPERSAAEGLADTLGVASSCLFVGAHRDVRRFLPAIDVGVISSNAVETLSLAALEMQACGIPMVMTDIGGASEIIKHGETGFLFRSEDERGLIEGIRHCLDPKRSPAMGAAARARMLDAFSYDKMVAKYAAFFDQFRN